MEYYNSVVRICVYLTLLVATIGVNGSGITFDAALIILNLSIRMSMATSDNAFEKCGNRSVCNIPLPEPLEQYYQEIGCKEVYEGKEFCCPSHYDCSHLKNKNKCYVNHHEYAIGEKLKEKDANLCEIDCICINTRDGVADFNCTSREEWCGAVEDSEDGCYNIYSPYECCHTEFCPAKPGNRSKCYLSDGREYKHGEYFVQKDRPDYTCICQPTMYSELGEAGALVGDFCWKQNRPSWSNLHAVTLFHRHCALVYDEINNRHLSGEKTLWRCPNGKDYVIPSQTPIRKRVRRANICKFGKIEMFIGEFLNVMDIDKENCYFTVCICMIPPVVTCYLSQKEFCNMEPEG